MNKEQLINKFHSCFLQFIDEFIEQFPTETNLHIIRAMVADVQTSYTLIESYVENILPSKDLIKARDEAFFLDESSGFSNLIDKNLLSLRNLWTCGTLDIDDKNTVWKWFDVFTMLAEKYQELH